MVSQATQTAGRAVLPVGPVLRETGQLLARNARILLVLTLFCALALLLLDQVWGVVSIALGEALGANTAPYRYHWVLSWVWIVPMALRTLILAVVITAWMRLAQSQSTGGLFTAMCADTVTLRCWALVLGLHLLQIFAREPLILAFSLFWNSLGAFDLRLQWPWFGAWGSFLGWQLIGLAGWFVLLPATVGYPRIARNTEGGWRSLVGLREGNWWHKGAILVILVAVVDLVGGVCLRPHMFFAVERVVVDVLSLVGYPLLLACETIVVATGALVIDRRLRAGTEIAP